MLFEASFSDDTIYPYRLVDITPYIISSTNDKLELEPEFLLASMRALKKARAPFVFLHTHPNTLPEDLLFSELDKHFEVSIIELAQKVEFLQPMVFLLAAAKRVIGRYYWNGEHDTVEIVDRAGAEKKLLLNAEIFFNDSLSKGVVYLPQSNSLAALPKESAKLLRSKQVYQKHGMLDFAQEEILNHKLGVCFPDAVQREFLVPTQPFFVSGTINKLEILVQTGCNLKCKYCFADGGTYGEQPRHFTAESGKQLIDTLVYGGIHKITEILFLEANPPSILTPSRQSVRSVRCFLRKTR